MVRKASLSLVFIIVFIFMIAFLLPKKNLVYFIQEQFQTSQILLSFDTIDEYNFGVEIKNLKLHLDKVLLLNSKNTSITSLIIYNKIALKRIVLSDIAKEFLPQHVEYIIFKSSLLNFLKITFKAKGEFGKMQGFVDIMARKIFIVLTPSVIMKKRYFRTLQYFTQKKNGKLVYEYSD